MISSLIDMVIPEYKILRTLAQQAGTSPSKQKEHNHQNMNKV